MSRRCPCDEVGHIGLVLELVQVVESLLGCMLRDTFDTKIERAVLVGATRPSMYATRCLDILEIAAPDLDAAIERY